MAARNVTGNEDIVAFITIPGTSISYAVAQGADNNFYLNRDLRGRPNLAGSIFMHTDNSPDFSDRSTILFGHNMLNRTKFSDLHMFRDLSFFEQNNLIEIARIEDVLFYDVFAVFETHISFNYIEVKLADDNAFLSLVENIKHRSMHPVTVSVSDNDQIIILSTCTDVVGSDYRFVVVGLRRFE